MNSANLFWLANALTNFMMLLALWLPIVLGDVRKNMMEQYCHKISRYHTIIIVTKFYKYFADLQLFLHLNGSTFTLNV